ncbi:MAG: outer membrane protein [Xanthobacteraceae bacterium]
MKRLLLGTSMSLAMLAGASAADMAPIYTKAPAYVPAYSWTGCYGGGNLGGVWAEKDWTVAAPSTPVGTPYGSNYPGGIMVGSQGGCNYQVGTFVFGIQEDEDWAHASGANTDLTTTNLQDRSTIMWLASVTGRIGYTWGGRFLGYVKGGAAWERDNYDTFVPTTNIVTSTASEIRSGWTVGVGGEYAFADFMSGFIEYDYYDFGTATNAFTVVSQTFSQNFVSIRERQNVVKAGLNFKLPSFP